MRLNEPLSLARRSAGLPSMLAGAVIDKIPIINNHQHQETEKIQGNLAQHVGNIVLVGSFPENNPDTANQNIANWVSHILSDNNVIVPQGSTEDLPDKIVGIRPIVASTEHQQSAGFNDSVRKLHRSMLENYLISPIAFTDEPLRVDASQAEPDKPDAFYEAINKGITDLDHRIEEHFSELGGYGDLGLPDTTLVLVTAPHFASGILKHDFNYDDLANTHLNNGRAIGLYEVGDSPRDNRWTALRPNISRYKIEPKQTAISPPSVDADPEPSHQDNNSRNGLVLVQ
ncbi:MAG: hypothetical protein NVS1B10_00020 [Candidatus Saccharimonadales bacterium]